MYDAIVLGGGVAGLATLEALTRRGLKRVALVERFRLAHSHGSSHGRSRIARGAYHDAVFAKLFRAASHEDWPRLERDAESTLLHPNTGCVFGPRAGQVPVYEEACRQAGVPVERITLQEARAVFPVFSFPDDYAVLRDNSSSVVAAAETLEALARLSRTRGAEILEETRCESITPSDACIALETNRGRLETERLIVTAGSWTRTLVPELAPRLTTVRQTVGYFELDTPPEAMRIGQFPVWIHLGQDEGDVHYGVPEFQRAGVKAALHRACAALEGGDDPEPTNAEPPQAELDELRDWFAPLLTPNIVRIVGGERCLYTLTSNEDFKLARLARDARITVGTGLSGHGFKFAPLLGRILSELSLDGTTSVPEFEEARVRFEV